jgi:uncharacterized membrane protein YbhN (UPF0104 family)
MLRRLLVALAAVLLVMLIATHRREVLALAEATTRARPQWLAVALLLQASSAACLAALYRQTLAATAVPLRFATACATLLATFAANLLAPSAGAAGLALWVDTLGRRGAPRATVAAGVLAASLLDAAALTVLAALAAVQVAATRALSALEIASAATLGALLLAGVLALGVAARRPDWWARRLDPDWPERTARLLGEAAGALAGRPLRLLSGGVLALAEHAASAAALGALGLAFGQQLDPLALLAAYALAMLAWVASPVPQGVGVVELVLAGTLTATGTPSPAALLVAVTHRGLTFWLPLGIGFVVLWRLETAARRP